MSGGPHFERNLFSSSMSTFFGPESGFFENSEDIFLQIDQIGELKSKGKKFKQPW